MNLYGITKYKAKHVILMFLCISYILPFALGASCKVDADCSGLSHCENHICVHKGFFPITVREIAGLVLIFIASLLANASGIGGGGLYVPILMVFNGFTLKESTPISKFMIFAGAIIAFIIGLIKNRNPEKGVGSSIDMNLVSYLVPFIIMGTQVGLVINIVAPQIILIIIMVIVMVFSSVKLMMSAFKILHNENQRFEAEAALQAAKEEDKKLEEEVLIDEAEEIKNKDENKVQDDNNLVKKEDENENSKLNDTSINPNNKEEEKKQNLLGQDDISVYTLISESR
jgi:hypothetical protein